MSVHKEFVCILNDFEEMRIRCESLKKLFYLLMSMVKFSMYVCVCCHGTQLFPGCYHDIFKELGCIALHMLVCLSIHL